MWKRFVAQPILVKTITVLCLAGLVWLGIKTIGTAKTEKIQYQTQAASKDTLIVSISASGQVSTANSATVTTEASGVVKTLFVKNGDSVKVGEKIAELELDLDGRQRSAAAYASWQGAKNTLDSAHANLYTAQSTMLSNWQEYVDKATSGTYENPDKTPIADKRTLTDFVTSQDDWLAAEAKYKIQQNAIIQAQSSLNNAWFSYQKTSPIMYAPISGTVTGLSMQEGSVITAQSNSSGGASAQKIASILTKATPIVTINITQIDVPKISIGNKATVTLDAFPDKTFAGTVVSIDTVGTTSSGVTTYPTVIKLDTDLQGILPNMSAAANIITASKTDVLVVQTSAITTTNGSSTVRIMKNGQPQEISVETGLSSDTQTEIISGLSEGDIVITGSTTTGTKASNASTTTSPFSAFGNRGFGGAGGQVRISR